MGKVFVVGLGPGGPGEITPRARQALTECDLLAGYTTYIQLVEGLFPDKEQLATGMFGEAERCAKAVQAAQSGRRVAMVCSGDAGIYGMAGLIFETAERQAALGKIEIEVIPGITAACSGAALLGAPRTDDFAVSSLSDLLAGWPHIERRLAAAAQADFAICLYNPSSRKRKDHLWRACEILLQYKDENTVAGLAQNVGRPGESMRLLTLRELKECETDMFTTVFVGSSKTRVIGGRMVTPRGYRDV